jgi:beta-carotene hydroxylase
MQQDLSVLNKQAIAVAQEYMGEVAWLTVAMVAFVVTAFVTNLWLFAAGEIPVWAATLVYAVLTYVSYTPLHEAAHGNIHGRNEKLQWLNDLCGYLVAPIITVPYSTHKVEHFTHHRYTNQGDKDPDFIVSGMRHGFLPLIVHGLKFLWVQNTFLFRDYWATASRRERFSYYGEVSFAIGWRVAFLLLVPTVETLIMLVLGYLVGAFFTAYWFAYRPHLPYAEPARYRNTNSLIMPVWMKPLEWFWFGQNLHSVHHLFPRVPFYRYHALHRRIEPIMRAHGTPMLGIFSREAVPATD